ncbi:MULTISPECIES: hypothetical protein [Aeromicrobium]|jgi:hypothetical protein|uniref:hypothetical protein n=1 Tax=Aeromicrobium TaxID=2040 RepID=UPI000832A038|nr:MULTISPECIES: hypothetical protein [Aeromicrobium]
MEPFPASPEPEYRPEGKGPRPASVATAVKLIWANVALSLLSAVLAFAMLDDLIDQAIDNAGSGATIDRDAARIGAIGAVVFGLIIGVGLAALFAYFIGKGANWARIVYTVLIVIGVLGSLAQLGGQPPVLLVLSLVSLAIGIAIVVFLYRPDSNAYFKKKA